MSDIVERLLAGTLTQPSNHSPTCDDVDNADALMIEAAEEITRLRQLISEAEKREREARDREAELVGMIAAADESRLLQIRRADAARNAALDDAIAAIETGREVRDPCCRDYSTIVVDYTIDEAVEIIRALQSEQR